MAKPFAICVWSGFALFAKYLFGGLQTSVANSVDSDQLA